MFETQEDQSGPGAAYRAEAAQLDRRIVLVATIVMAELWAMTTAIEAWAEGASLGGILMFQLVGFVLAVGFWKVPVARPMPEPVPELALATLAQESAAG